MANQEHVDHLLNGVGHWNAWRRDNSEVPDLANANLEDANLQGANLESAELRGAELRGADLQGADLALARLDHAILVRAKLQNARFIGASLKLAKLQFANLDGANLRGVNLQCASLGNATLVGANLHFADLGDALLGGADFYDAILAYTNLNGANLEGAKFQGAYLGGGSVATDWRRARGLADVVHTAPLKGAMDASRRSAGSLPDEFLRGCGWQDWEIQVARLHQPELANDQIIDITKEIARLRRGAPIQPRGVFISYSRKDSDFVDRLAEQLSANHVRFWRDVDHMFAGPKGPQIDRAIVLHRTVLLVLSENAIESDWVALEVSKARELEKKGVVDYALCPVTLDMAWKESDWPEPLRYWFENKYNILSFSETDDFDHRFQQLLKGLEIYYPEKVV